MTQDGLIPSQVQGDGEGGGALPLKRVECEKCNFATELSCSPGAPRPMKIEFTRQPDNVLDILVQSRRNKQAAKKFFRKLLKSLTYVPRVIITDKLKSYGAAKREILPGVEHRQSRYLNN